LNAIGVSVTSTSVAPFATDSAKNGDVTDAAAKAPLMAVSEVTTVYVFAPV